MKYLFLIATIFFFSTANADEEAIKKKAKEIREKIAHHEKAIQTLKKQLAELEGPTDPIAKVEREIKVIEGKIKDTRRQREAKKKEVYKPYDDAVEAVEAFEKKLKNDKKALKKKYRDAVKDWEQRNNKRCPNDTKKNIELAKYTTPLRKLEAELTTLKNKVDKDKYKDLWKEEMKPFTAKIKAFEKQISGLNAKKRALKKAKGEKK